jgi:biopolymer transport protein ExbB
MLQKEHDNYFFLVSLDSVGLLGLSGMIKAFGALAAAGTLIKRLCRLFLVLINTATGIGTSAVAIISYSLL